MWNWLPPLLQLLAPIGLAGLVLLIFFGIQRLLVSSTLLSRVSSETSGQILKILMSLGFLVALFTLFRGFELVFFQHSQLPSEYQLGILGLDLGVFLLLAWRVLDHGRTERRVVAEKQAERPPVGNSLLHYLADRDSQQDGLERALAYSRELPGPERPPIICLAHGEYCEHDGWSARSRALLNASELSPMTLRGQNLSDLRERLRESVEREQWVPRINQSRARNWLLHFTLYSQHWLAEDEERNAAGEFIAFWAEQNLAVKQHCLILLCLQYNPEEAQGRAINAWCRRLEDEFCCPDTRRPDLELFRRRFGLPGLILPRFEPVNREDALSWLEHRAVQRHCRDKYPTEALRAPILQLYRQRDTLPMQELAVELEQLLQRHCV